MDCWFDTNNLQTGTERHVIQRHLDRTNYVKHTDMSVGSRVAINNVNHLPEIELFNREIGTVIDIVYGDSIVGPTNK